MNARKLVGLHDMMLNKPIGQQSWARTSVIQKGDRTIRACYLIECEVGDPNRFGYLNGTWWKLEAADFEQYEPRKRTFTDQLGSYTLVECGRDDPEKLFYSEGTHWKQEG